MAAAGSSNDFVLYERGQNDESDAWDDSVLIKAYDDAVSVIKAKIAAQNPEYSPKAPNKTKKKRRSKGKDKKKAKSHQDSRSKFSVGDLCQAIFTEDGEVYEAIITSVDEEEGTCTVQYIGYGNQEEQELGNLLPARVSVSSQDQQTDTASEVEEVTSNQGHTHEAFSSNQRGKTNSAANKRPPKRQQQQQQQQPFHWFNGPPFAPPFGAMPPPPPPPPNFLPFQVPGYQASGPSMPPPPVFPSIPPPPPPFPDRGSGDENEALYSMLISWYMSGYHTGYYQGLKHGASAHGAQR